MPVAFSAKFMILVATISFGGALSCAFDCRGFATIVENRRSCEKLVQQLGCEGRPGHQQTPMSGHSVTLHQMKSISFKWTDSLRSINVDGYAPIHRTNVSSHIECKETYVYSEVKKTRCLSVAVAVESPVELICTPGYGPRLGRREPETKQGLILWGGSFGDNIDIAYMTMGQGYDGRHLVKLPIGTCWGKWIL